MKAHEGQKEVQFTWKVLRSFQKPLSRQLFEAICIEQKEENVNLNSKREYFRYSTEKITMCNNDYQCNQCGKKFTAINDMKFHKRKFHENMHCSKCDYISFGEIDLKHHLVNKHTIA